MDALFGCSYKNLLDWLVFFPEPNHNKICWEQTHVKMDLGEVLHMRNMSNLLKAKKWKTKWDFTRQILLRNISIWKEIAHFDTLARKWIPDFWINRNHGVEVVFQRWKVLMSSPFLQAIFSWSQIISFFSFSTVSKTIFLESLSSINTHRSWYNLCFFGSFHFLKGLSLSLLSVFIMFVNEIIFLTNLSGGCLDSLHQ